MKAANPVSGLQVRGARAWVYGDDVNTDLLAPSAYLMLPDGAAAAHCLEDLDPGFATGVTAGDALVAGGNLGIGSSRETAARNLLVLGVAVVLAPAFGRIFYRNCLNLGLPAVVCADAGRIRHHQRIDVDPLAGRVRVCDSGEVLACEPLPAHLLPMLRAGGLLAWLRARAAAPRPATPGR